MKRPRFDAPRILAVTGLGLFVGLSVPGSVGGQEGVELASAPTAPSLDRTGHARTARPVISYRERWTRVRDGVRPCLALEPDPDRAECLRGLEEEARAAVALRPDRPEGHYWLAVAVGSQVDDLGGSEKVAAASEVYQEASMTLQLDRDHPGAHHLLGRLQAGVLRMGRLTRFLAARLLGGDALKRASWEEAEALLRFAEEKDPAIPEHHYELAVLYRDRGRPGEARLEAEHVLAMELGPNDERIRAQAVRLLDSLPGDR